MCNEAYVIEKQEEKPLPINVQEVMMMSFICSFRNKNEAVFRARLAASLCTEGCRVAGDGPAGADVRVLGGMQTMQIGQAQAAGLDLSDGGLLLGAQRRGGRKSQAGAREMDGVA